MSFPVESSSDGGSLECSWYSFKELWGRAFGSYPTSHTELYHYNYNYVVFPPPSAIENLKRGGGEYK